MSVYKKLPWSFEESIENMKAVKEMIIERVKLVNLDGKWKEDVEEVEFDFNRAIEAMEKTRWIPCSERLPEEKGEYLVSFGKNTKTVIETFDGVYFSERNYFLQPEAWMPLPEPYKEETE